MAAIASADLIVTAARAPRGEHSLGPFVTITLGYGEECTWDGGAESRSELEHHYGPVCHPDAVNALCDAWQVTLIDPQWGPNDHTSPLLQPFATPPSPHALH